jgi:hypothetical protein
VRRLYVPILCCMFIAAFVLASPPEPKKCMCDPTECASKCFSGDVPCCCSEEPADELEGVWWTEAKKDGKIGTVTLHKGGADSYIATWVSGPVVSQGVLSRKGKWLACAWSDGPGKLGIMWYSINGDVVESPTEVWTKAKPPKRV